MPVRNPENVKPDERMELAREIEAAFGHLNEVLHKAACNRMHVEIDVNEFQSLDGVKHSVVSATIMDILIRT